MMQTPKEYALEFYELKNDNELAWLSYEEWFNLMAAYATYVSEYYP